jgi:hypothetical protein
MRIDWQRAILAGIIGTVVFDVLGLVLTGQWGVPMLLGSRLGVGRIGGAVAHYTNGVLLAIIYAGVAPSLWGPDRARALTYMTIQTVLGVWLFLNPLVGMGIAGLEGGPMVPVGSLIRHWAFGLVLAWLYPVAKALQVDPQAVVAARLRRR